MLGWALAGSAVLGFMGSQNQASAATDAAQIQANAAQAGQQLQQQNFQNLSPNFCRLKDIFIGINWIIHSEKF